MLTRNQIKFYSSLQHKKYRLLNNLFVAEGRKLVQEAVNSNFNIHSILATNTCLEETTFLNSPNIIEVTQSNLNKISSMSSPADTMAIIEIINHDIPQININQELTIVLDNINDPGNLGTIIRLADWFGIKNIVCSENTVDLYNPKVVQSSMGAIFRTKIYYTNLYDFLQNIDNIKIYGTFMKGENIYKQATDKHAVIILGSESHGISAELHKFVHKKIMIPAFNNSNMESLNVATAAAIIISEFKRTG